MCWKKGFMRINLIIVGLEKSVPVLNGIERPPWSKLTQEESL
jgi:hypothetical protein